MGLFLLIDTALPKGMVCLADENKILEVFFNEEPLQHAAWLHVAINQIIEKNKVSFYEIDAVGVTIGPGSYTGLRIGLSAAKGLCYAWKKPMITVNNLELIALANYDENVEVIIPMIDARREEVYTSSYDNKLQCIESTHGLILNSTSFAEPLKTKQHIFCGTAAGKLSNKIKHSNAQFQLHNYSEANFYTLIKSRFTAQIFSDLAYVEPDYGKNFMLHAGKNLPII